MGEGNSGDQKEFLEIASEALGFGFKWHNVGSCTRERMAAYSGEEDVDTGSAAQSSAWREREKMWFSFVSIVHQ